MTKQTAKKNITGKTAAAAAEKAKKSVKKTVSPTKSPAAKKIAPAKPVAKTAAKASSKPVASKASIAKPPVAKKAVKVSAAAAKDKAKKMKLVRDSFAMPEAEYAVLGDVKKSCLKIGIEIKKSELLRIGVAVIRDMSMNAIKQALAALPPLKVGRPRKIN